MPLNVRNIDITGLISYTEGAAPAPSVPVANFTANSTSGTVSLSVNFTDLSTNTPTSWSWNFGDGTTSTQQNPSKTYSSTGTYTVSLTATNASGSNTNTKTNYISVTDVVPISGFSAAPTSGTIPLTVNFTNASTGTNLTYGWNFGDGTTSTSTSPSKTYSNTGSYTVSLTSSNTAGVSTSTQVITANDVAPIAGFSATPTSGTSPLTVAFTNASTGTNLTYLWDFKNDGTATSTQASPSYTYTTGTYSVKLTASNSAGSSTSTISNLITAVAAIPDDFKYTTLQLPGTGANNATNNTFVDSSSNNFTVTRVGNTTQGTFTPYSDAAGYWSNYFDGTGDYLTATSPNLPGTWTVECWWYPTNGVSTQQTIISFNNGSLSGINIWCNTSSRLVVDNGTNAQTAFTGGLFVANTWNHVAVVRDGLTTTGYINGIQVGSNSFTPSTTSVVSIGRYNSSPFYYVSGYISNVRVVNGTALYTANFTPPTSPLTAIGGTSLLTCNNNRFMDSSSNNFTVTRFGDTRVQSFGPFTPARIYSTSVVGGSMYFDGTGDSLSIANNTALNLGSGNFTVEAWFRTTVDLGASSYAIHFGKWNTGALEYLLDYNSGSLRWFNAGNAGLPIITAATTITSNTWYHVAVVRSDNTTTLYLNGVSVGTPSTNTTYTNLTAPLMIGYKSDGNGTGFYTGYISNFRLVKGTAVYTANFTPPTAPLTAVSGTSLLLSGTNAGIYDASMSTIVETAGGAKISTTISASGSMYFDGTGDYLTAPTSDNFGYGTGDFTIELWAYMNTIAGDETIISNLTSVPSVNPHLFRNVGTLWYWTNGGERIRSANILAAQTWTHIAICRASGSTRLFVNGVQTGSTYADTNNYGSTAPLAVGTYWSGGTPVGVTTFNGYMNDVRITKGLARYTTTFTPPTRS